MIKNVILFCKKRALKTIAGVLGVSIFIAFSSNANDNYKIRIKDGFFYENVQSKGWTYSQVKDNLNGYLHYSDLVEWNELENVTNENGIQRVALVPSISGIPMEGNMVVLHFKDGKLQSWNGNIGKLDKSISNIPQIAKEVAIQNAANHFALHNSSSFAKSELVIRNAQDENRLAWKVNLTGISQKDAAYKNMIVYVDALNGAILHSYSKVSNATETVNGQSLYYGEVEFEVNEEVNGEYRLINEERGVHITHVGGQIPGDFGGSLNAMFPNRREIVSDSSYFSPYPTIREFIVEELPSSFLSGYGMNGFNITLPGIVLIEKQGNEADTISLTLTSEDMMASSISLPLHLKNVYTHIKEGYEYELGFEKSSLSFLNMSRTIDDAIYVPLTDLTVGLHNLNPNPEFDISYEVMNSANLGVDAMYGIFKASEYFDTKFNRNSFDDQGSIANVLVDGAMFLGFTQMNAMAMTETNTIVFGYGDGYYMSPLTSLDILVHEYQHLVTDYNGRGGLEYSKESGAINESLSDIFAKTIEFEVHPNEASWKIGKEISLFNNGYFRDMENPKAPDNGLGMIMPKQPNTYLGRYWLDTNSQEDNGGVHYNSGVGNKWYYLLVEGGYGTNDNDDDYTVEGIGFDKAIQIVYKALMERFTPTTTYPQAAVLTEAVAVELFGEDSDEHIAVKDAWFAVGLGEDVISVKEKDLNEFIYDIYPNPAKDRLYINNKSSELMNIAIHNVNGQKVLSHEALQGKQSISLEGMTSGIYFVTLEVNGQKKVEKLVVQ